MGTLSSPGRGRPTRAAGLAAAAPGRTGTIEVLASCSARSDALVRLLHAGGLAAVAVDAERLSAGIRSGTSAAAVVTGSMLRSAAGHSLARAVGDQPAWSDFPFVIVPARGRRGAGPDDPMLNAVTISRPLRCEALLSATSSALRARHRQRAVATMDEPSARYDADSDPTPPRPPALALYASRVSAMGDMASALAHEVNQPLCTITNYVASCRRLLVTATRSGTEANLPSLLSALTLAETETMRAGEIVRRMRGTVAVAKMPCRPTRLIDIIDQACGIAHFAGTEVAVEVQGASHGMEVAVDCAAIQHVIVNLVRNSVDGVQDGAEAVRVATRPGKPGFAEVRVYDPRPLRNEISECDPVCAAAASQADHARITLAICRTIVEAHGGAIDAAGRGADACVAFTLPLAAASSRCP